MKIENGFVLISRNILDSDVFASQKLLKIWIWCLCKASYKTRTIPLNIGKGETIVRVQRGQFVFGRHKAEDDLFIDGSTIYKSMKKIESLGMINIESNNQFSIITICNYDSYQSPESYQVTSKEQVSNNQVTSKEQVSNNQVTSKEQVSNTYNNVNNVNNVKKEKKEKKEKNENSFFEKNSDFENSELKSYDDMKLQEDIKQQIWKSIKNEIWNSHTYLNDLAMKSEEVFGKKMTYDEIRTKLKEFGTLLSLRGECKETLNDFKIHLVNWLKNEVSKELKNPNKKSVAENYNEIKTALAKKYENYSDNQIFIEK